MTPFSYNLSVSQCGHIQMTKIREGHSHSHSSRIVRFQSLANFEKHFKRYLDSPEIALKRSIVAWAFKKMFAYEVSCYGSGDVIISTNRKINGNSFGPSTGIGG